MVESVTTAHSPEFLDAEEKRLVDLAKIGDLDSRSSLYEKYRPILYGYFISRVGDPDKAVDLVQETSKRAFVENIGSFKWKNDGVPFGSWVFRIAHNKLVSDLRKTAMRRKQNLSPSNFPTFDPGSLHDKVERRLLYETVMSHMNVLHLGEYDVITSRFIEGLSISETAGKLDKSESSVKALQNRGIRRLRVSLSMNGFSDILSISKDGKLNQRHSKRESQTHP